MDKIEKFKTMEKVLREIEDLKNSETAVIKKIGQIETENMNLNIQDLENQLHQFTMVRIRILKTSKVFILRSLKRFQTLKRKTILPTKCCWNSVNQISH